MRWLVATLCVSVLMPGLVPEAQAQTFGQFKPTLDLRVESQTMGPLAPDGPQGNATIRWTYTFKESTTAVLAQGEGGTTIRFHSEGCSLPGVELMVPATAEVVFDAGEPTRSSYTGLVTIVTRILPTAPVGTVMACRIGATADAVNSQIVETEAAPVGFTVVAAFGGVVSAMFEPAVVEGLPGKSVGVAVHLRNVGTQDASVRLLLNGTLPDGWSVSIPEGRVVVPARVGDRAGAGLIPLLVQLPAKEGWNQEEVTIRLHVEVLDGDGSLAAATRFDASLLAKVRGCYALQDGGVPDDCLAMCETVGQPGGCPAVRGEKATPPASAALIVALLALVVALRRRNGA